MVYETNIETQKDQVLSLTERVESLVAASGVREGMCFITVPHTTAGLIVTSKYDEADFADIKNELRRLVPTRVDFCHQFDTPEDAAGHIKSALTGVSLAIIVTRGRLLLGSSQGIFFLEFDGPRGRKYHVKIMPD
ncbi:MAG: secondary thiamine-phosphate synthase enzyme YjbQ [Peptococcaceae bacterium]|jgi:secondary thiamine-phosphate synthase enzyme|nr:secondary thiamine-phosphate synthase enzyme YjbQ [Peptococcaceae bacterium]